LARGAACDEVDSLELPEVHALNRLVEDQRVPVSRCESRTRIAINLYGRDTSQACAFKPQRQAASATKQVDEFHFRHPLILSDRTCGSAFRA
jgi:hypothetical protein